MSDVLDMHIWYDIEKNKMHLKHDGEHYIADAMLFNIIRKLSNDLEVTKAENSRLRELAEDMLDCIEIRAAFNRPPTSEMYEGFAQRADNLGIEVGE